MCFGRHLLEWPLIAVCSQTTQIPIAFENLERVAGHIHGHAPGPLVICLGGIHGNEPAGVLALQRVIPRLREMRGEMRGAFLGLVGNLAALARGQRYIHKDLNRIWDDASFERDGSDGRACAEALQRRELRRILEDAVRTHDGPVYFLDLHTTSSVTAPFAVINDTLRNRAFARRFPIPLVLGLEEKKSGTVADFVHSLGAITMGLEAGRHQDAVSVDRHEAGVWLALGAAKCLSDRAPEVRRRRRLLADSAKNLPETVEIRYRHRVSAEQGFRMKTGFSNLAAVRKGQAVAQDRSGTVWVSQSGYLLLPLYQESGDDGFFVVRRVRPAWLAVSAALRRLGADRLAHRLPGVARHPTHESALLVDPGVARWYTVEVFHLLGFRQRNTEGGRLVFSRRLRDHP